MKCCSTLLISFIFVLEAQGLRCYFGTSLGDQDDKMTSYDCSPRSKWCIKTVSEQNGQPTNTSRWCSGNLESQNAEWGCKVQDNGKMSIETCHCATDLCNLANGQVGLSSMVLISAWGLFTLTS